MSLYSPEALDGCCTPANDCLGSSVPGCGDPPFMSFNIHPNPKIEYFYCKGEQKWKKTKNNRVIEFASLPLDQQRDYLIYVLMKTIDKSFGIKNRVYCRAVFEFSQDKSLHLHGFIKPAEQFATIGTMVEMTKSINKMVNGYPRPIKTKFVNDCQYTGCKSSYIESMVDLEKYKAYMMKQQDAKFGIKEFVQMGEIKSLVNIYKKPCHTESVMLSHEKQNSIENVSMPKAAWPN